MDDRRLASSAGLTRVALGGGMVVAPVLAGRTFLGGEASRPATQAALRMLGVRDLLLGLGLWRAANGGRSTKSWLAYAAVADAVDAAAGVLSWRALPKRGRSALVAVALASAAANAALSARTD